MQTKQIIWLCIFLVITVSIILISYFDPGRIQLHKVLGKKHPVSVILFSVVALGFIIADFFIGDEQYHKCIGLGIIALITAMFAELGLMFAPFFLVICFGMTFPNYV
jgi:hypothetical protein